MASTIPHRLQLLAALVVASALSSCGVATTSPTASTLYFSAIPDTETTELRERYALVAGYLTAQLGVPVEYRHAADYAASVEAFKNGDVQLAWFGGVTGVQARAAVEGARAIAQGAVDPTYKSYFIANASTGIQPSDSFPLEMRGRSFTFGSRSSTSGRVMPEHFIRQNTGQAPAEFFEHPDKFSGSHSSTWSQVQDGTVDCGALSYKEYDRKVATGDIDPAVCVKVWTTPTYPDYNWTAHPSLEATFGTGFIKKLQTVLVTCKDPAVLKALTREEGLIVARDADFEPIARTMAQVGLQ